MQKSRALTALEMPDSNAPFTQAAWVVAVGLDYLEFRLSDKVNWRAECLTLVDFFQNIKSLPIFTETAPVL